MNWYLFVKFLHIVAVAITIGAMFARQLIRAHAMKSEDVATVASLTGVALRLDRALVIPGSNMMIVLGVILAIMLKWPIFGFLQGASQNWLLVSNILLVIPIALIAAVFIPHNKKVALYLQEALEEGRVTPELSAALGNKTNKLAHQIEETVILLIAALMVLKPF